MAEPDLIISAGFSDAQLVKEANRIVAMYAKKGEEAQKAFQDAQGRVTNTQAAKAHVKDLDRLARAYDPVYRAAKEYEAEVARLDRALAVGAVTHERYADLVQQAAAKQAAAVDLASGATERAASAARAAEKIARESASADEAAAVAAQRLAVEKEQLRLKLDPLYAASKRYETALMDLDRALELGSLSAQQHGAAMEKLNADYARTAVVADQSAAEQARAQMEATEAAERLAAEMDRLKTKYDPVYAASKRYEASLIELDRALDKGALSAKQHEIALEKLNAEYARTAVSAGSSGSKIEAAADKSQAAVSRSSGVLKGQIQSTAFQIQDFAVQVASGTSASTALAQQLPQLLGGLGALGAVLGVVVAVGVPLASMFFNSGENAEALKKQIDSLQKTLDTYKGTIDKALAPMEDLWKQFGVGADAARDTYAAMLEIERIEYLKGMRAGVVAVSEQLTSLTDALARYQGAVNSTDGLGEAKALAVQSALNELQKYFGLSAQEADKVNQALQNMAAARDQGPAAAAQAAKELGDALMVAYDQGGRTNDTLLDAAKRAYELQLNAAEAARVMGDVADGAANAADGTITAADAAEAARAATENWAAAMSGVRAEIGAIASALASMGGGMIANASKFVELNALKQGKSVAEAAQARQKAQMEADFAAREMAAGTWVEKMVLKGEKALAERGLALDGELEAARSEARKAEQAAAKATGGGGRKKSGGGGGSRAAKEPVNILESADREIQQLERQIELLGKSNQEVAVAEARWAMLDAAKKAGIPVNDTLNAQIDQQAAQVGNLTQQLEQAQLQQEQFDQAIEGIANAFSNAILEGENLRDSLASIFKQIAANILNAGIQQALTQAFSGAGGGGGGWFSGLLSAAFGGTKAAVPSYDGGGFTGYGSRSGGVDGKGGELAILHPNETVLDHTRGQSGPGGSQSYAMTIDLRGTTGDRELDAKIARAGQAILAQVPATMRNHQQRRG